MIFLGLSLSAVGLGNPGEALVDEARRGPHCTVKRIQELQQGGGRIPVSDWMVWYPEVVGCGNLTQEAYLSTPKTQREALALLGISGVLEHFQKLRSSLRADITARKEPAHDATAVASRIAKSFHFLRGKMAGRCRMGNRVACDIARRASAFRSSLRSHLRTAHRSSEVKHLPKAVRRKWLRALRDTANPFIR